jgi:uncharacterized coiled-coil DUF342 family protein
VDRCLQAEAQAEADLRSKATAEASAAHAQLQLLAEQLRDLTEKMNMLNRELGTARAQANYANEERANWGRMIEHANTAAIESSARSGAWVHDSSTGSMLLSEATLPSSVGLVF